MAVAHKSVNVKGQTKYLHRLKAEKAVGYLLPRKVHVHHMFGKENGTLVVCQDSAYHQLLHVRQRAWLATGDAHKRKCLCCKQWDDPENLIHHTTHWYHRECAIERSYKWYHANSDEVLADKKKLYKEQRESILQKRKEYAVKNIDAIHERIKNYRKNNIEMMRARDKERYQREKERRLAWQNEYYQINREEINKRRREKRMKDKEGAV